MPTVHVPALYRDLTGGMETVELPGKTVREVVSALEARFPGIEARLCDQGRLRPHIAVSVDGEITPLRLRQPLEDDSVVHFLPAISGGNA
jgi:sulfur-carrier protein